MAMKMKEFDFKQFLLEKGERVGLYAAGGIALLMIILSLFMPHKGILSDSPRGRAEAISTIAQQKKRDVAQNAPSEEEAKQLRVVDPQLLKQASSASQDPESFRLPAELFAPREIPSNK